MTKEEIFKKYFHPVTEDDVRLTRSILNAMKEYADQQTEALKAEVERLDNENKLMFKAFQDITEFFRRNNITYNENSPDTMLAHFISNGQEYLNENKQLQSELSELKEKADKYDKLSNKDKVRANLGKPSKWVLKALMKENEELKERHKEDVIDSYNEGYRDGENDGANKNPNDMDVSLFSNAEQYYNQKFKSNEKQTEPIGFIPPIGSYFARKQDELNKKTNE